MGVNADIHPRLVAAVKEAAKGNEDVEQHIWLRLMLDGVSITTEGKGKRWRPSKGLLKTIKDAAKDWHNKDRNSRRIGRRNLVLWEPDWLDALQRPEQE